MSRSPSIDLPHTSQKIRTHPTISLSNRLYLPPMSTTKNTVANVLLPLVNSTNITPFTSVISPVKALKLVLVFMSLLSWYPIFSNVANSITLTPAPASYMIRCIIFPCRYPVTNKGRMCIPNLLGFWKTVVFVPRANSMTPMSGDRNSSGNSNTMFIGTLSSLLSKPWSMSSLPSYSSHASLFSPPLSFLGHNHGPCLIKPVITCPFHFLLLKLALAHLLQSPPLCFSEASRAPAGLWNLLDPALSWGFFYSSTG
jgi:hypothetical protein